ncbi:MAG TPA: biliverdin-producing heme oxygenase [Flavisolibacter sp.]|nr:biliverdin-producing heme oxygenase [Flavisolibacter sp.]
MPLALTTASVAQVVKKETAFLHQEVEELLLPKLNAIQSPEDYAAILQMFYGFFHPVEEAIQAYISAAILPDIAKRRTALLVVDNLAYLEKSINLLQCKALPQITDTAQAFGAMYVLEGATLGGRMISKMLAKNPALSLPPVALNFFSGYKEETGSMWTAFIEVLNRQKDADTIVHSANQTFYYLKNWMQETLCYESKN